MAGSAHRLPCPEWCPAMAAGAPVTVNHVTGPFLTESVRSDA